MTIAQCLQKLPEDTFIKFITEYSVNENMPFLQYLFTKCNTCKEDVDCLECVSNSLKHKEVPSATITAIENSYNFKFEEDSPNKMNTLPLCSVETIKINLIKEILYSYIYDQKANSSEGFAKGILEAIITIMKYE